MHAPESGNISSAWWLTDSSEVAMNTKNGLHSKGAIWSVIKHVSYQKHPGGLETGPIFHTKLQVRSMFQSLTCGGHEIFAQYVCVSPLPLEAVGHERAIYFPRPLRTQGICVASDMCASSKNVNIPKPPVCVASNMCASSKNVNIPKPPIC